jgi:hypothetical protein
MRGVLLLRFHDREKVDYDAWYFNGSIGVTVLRVGETEVWKQFP